MIALPKRVIPASPKDRFLAFVEKANASMDDIKSSLKSSDYMTKTVGYVNFLQFPIESFPGSICQGCVNCTLGMVPSCRKWSAI